MSNLLKALWHEPRIPDAAGPGWRDLLLVAIIALLALSEGLLRQELVWRTFSVALTSTLALTLPWRRTHPAHMVVITFGANAAVQVFALLSGVEWGGTYTSVFLLILPYALLRWGSGKEACTGLGFVGITFATTITLQNPPLSEIVGASLFILFPSALGASVRYQGAAQQRANEQVRLREREQLARELHDTVGHYVSAIAVQAQAGRALASTRPEAPFEALGVIEEAASKTLSEMRSIVRAMRGDEEATFAPAASVTDIQRLAQDNTCPLEINVTLEGELSDLDTAIVSTLFRLTQESITNAVRHARGAKNLTVEIMGDTEGIHLKIHDDGTHVPQQVSPGLGLKGMTERVALLGGTLRAGPGAERGWTVEATLPGNGTPV